MIIKDSEMDNYVNKEMNDQEEIEGEKGNGRIRIREESSEERNIMKQESDDYAHCFLSTPRR